MWLLSLFSQGLESWNAISKSYKSQSVYLTPVISILWEGPVSQACYLCICKRPCCQKVSILDLMLCPEVLKFKQGSSQLHFALGLTNYAAGPGARC